MRESAGLKIVSGGQSGVDRAALDVAVALGFEYGGWCPRGGRAEDILVPPGLLRFYPALRATRTSDYHERTRLNVQDSDATLIIATNRLLVATGGTGYTVQHAMTKQKPLHVSLLTESRPNLQTTHETVAWIKHVSARYGRNGTGKIALNVAGPRASKAPDIYRAAYAFLKNVLLGAPG